MVDDRPMMAGRPNAGPKRDSVYTLIRTVDLMMKTIGQLEESEGTHYFITQALSDLVVRFAEQVPKHAEAIRCDFLGDNEQPKPASQTY